MHFLEAVAVFQTLSPTSQHLLLLWDASWNLEEHLQDVLLQLSWLPMKPTLLSAGNAVSNILNTSDLGVCKQ